MSIKGGICALALALAGLAGCLALPRSGSDRLADPNQERLYVGSFDVVVRTTESILQQRDIHYRTEPDGDELRIHATTEKNGRFTIHVTREIRETGKPERVRVRIDWESGPREPIDFFLFGTLEALSLHK
jgi:hypothetical protein